MSVDRRDAVLQLLIEILFDSDGIFYTADVGFTEVYQTDHFCVSTDTNKQNFHFISKKVRKTNR